MDTATVSRVGPGVKASGYARLVIRCLGEALVDLICERPASSLSEADSFRAHFGGALANVAVAAARAGADAGLAGAAGDDEWGRWLRARLAAEGVDLAFFDLAEGAQTPVAFATVDASGEPSFVIYGEAIADALDLLGPRLEELADSADALVFNSTTLAEAGERKVTDGARALALQRSVRVCFDPNIRPNRWRGGYEEAVGEARERVAGSFLVRANRDEAMAITGADDPRRAADALASMDVELAVVTLGAEGTVMRGACEAEEPSPQVEVVSTLGAGDAFMGTLVAGLAERGWDPARGGEALAPALAAAARACTRVSALD
jgi:sugar/nucleoside kinase (ribokinase family)